MTEFQYLDEGNTEAMDRLASAFLFAQSQAGKAAVGVLNGLQVTQNTTAGPAVLVAAGAGVTQDTVTNGVAMMVNDTQKTLNILTGNPMGATPRNDLVVFDAGTKTIRAVIGTPNASPSDPSLPANSIPLARVRNAASATTIPTSAIDDLRAFTTLYGVPPNIPFAQSAGVQTGFSAGSHAAGGVVSTSVSFPAGRFSQAPLVTVSLSTAPSGSAYLVARVGSVTTSGFTMQIYNTGTAAASYTGVSVNWAAIQMTAAAAAG